MDKFFEDLNFPYKCVRAEQDKFIKKVYENILANRNLLVSAPTGLGKTISALAPALKIAKEKNLTVVFLTSRQTQANQAIKTIADISKVSEKSISYVAFIGKRNMCSHPDRDLYPASDFNEFCKKARESGKCKFFKNSKNEEYEEQILSILKQSSSSFLDVESFVELSSVSNFCSYELAARKAFHCDVVICDFNYLFAPGLMENFLGRIGRNLGDCIVVVDEAHNLPDRVRNAFSYSLTTEVLKNALKELGDFYKEERYDFYIKNLKAALEDIYFERMLGEKKDYLIEKKEFLQNYMQRFSKSDLLVEKIVEELRIVEARVKEDRVISYCGRVANFLEKWSEVDEEGFLRVVEKDVQKDKTILSVKIKCIDPSIQAANILNNTYSSILMSATLTPITMYRDILGVANCDVLELDSPFSSKNQLTLVLDDVTSKYTSRSPAMYELIAEKIRDILGAISGKNAIFFFPSYDFQQRVLSYLKPATLGRQILKEQRFMTKEQKEEIVRKFRERGTFEDRAKVLFAITSGSFSEGLDLPDKALELVGVVGLPLGVPDVFTQAVIRYFDRKFKKGQMYGYVYPAMNKIIQAAGRCIRTEKDKGVIVLMDSRFIYPTYALSFPSNWKLRVAKNPMIEISNFFDE